MTIEIFFRTDPDHRLEVTQDSILPENERIPSEQIDYYISMMRLNLKQWFDDLPDMVLDSQMTYIEENIVSDMKNHLLQIAWDNQILHRIGATIK